MARSARRKTSKSREPVFAPVESAALALGKLEPGLSLSMITRGQFSILDLLMAVLQQTGPAHVIVSTWTMGIRDAENAAALVKDGRILSLRFLVDRSFPTRQPKYCAAVRERFGPEAFVMSRVHAKFAVVLGGSLPVVVRSSMNLNRNRRWEQADVDVDAALCSFYAGLVEELGGRMPKGMDTAEEAIEQAMMGDWESRLRAAPLANPVTVAAAAVLAPAAVDPEYVLEAGDPRGRTAFELRSFIAGAVEDRSWTAVGNLRRQLDAVERELWNERRDADRLEAELAAAVDSVLESELVDALRAMPDSQLEAALARLHPARLEAALARQSMH